MRIGILGGTFNPIHLGHLILAEEVGYKLNLDKVIFVPTYLPPHKDTSEIASAIDRFKMVKLAIKRNRRFSVSDIEIKRKGRSYTIDTIQEFKKMYPHDELYFIIGSDLISYLDSWKDLDRILKLIKFIVATRPGYSLSSLPDYISKLDIRAIDISGFQIREAIKNKKPFRYLLPEAVYKYINKKGLYR
ncbi:MAG: nicotinate-nucleotide adenylyltransferase [Candidatus Omnitrophica bacterium]|nr:nicotinate-nucleotide adenylyltransferase [Candidatus Omnitrophota bacterium]